MRFLTSEWAMGGLSEEEWESRWIAYQEHQRAVLPRLSAGAEHLVADVNLHDAVPKDCMIDEPTILLRFVAGDLQRGYELVELTYSDAEISGPTAADVRDWLGDSAAEEGSRGSGPSQHGDLGKVRGVAQALLDQRADVAQASQ